MKLKIYLPLMILLLLFSGCKNILNINDPDDDNNRENTIHGSGRIKSEVRNVIECSGLVLQNAGTIYLKQDEEQSIIVEADDNIMKKAIAREENGTLILGLKDGSYSNITLNFYVSLKNIRNISIEGAGKIIPAGLINQADLNCVINGAGNIHLKGTTSNFSCTINGSGNIVAEELISSKCKAVVNGAGHCSVYASNELEAFINGVGSIFYYGNPPIVHSSIQGTGQITRKP